MKELPSYLFSLGSSLNFQLWVRQVYTWNEEEELEVNHTTQINPGDQQVGGFFFFSFFLFRAVLVAYGGSQARGLIRAVAAGLCQSHSSARSEPCLRPTPQLGATLDPQPNERGQELNLQPHGSQLDSLLLCHDGNSSRLEF